MDFTTYFLMAVIVIAEFMMGWSLYQVSLYFWRKYGK